MHALALQQSDNSGAYKTKTKDQTIPVFAFCGFQVNAGLQDQVYLHFLLFGQLPISVLKFSYPRVH